jgi:PAS domain S-box-containing protein
LTTIVPGQPPMMANTAVGLLAIGMAGALRERKDAGRFRRATSLLLALVVLTLGIGTLAEYTFATDLGIDQLLVANQPGPYPGRPSPLTALALAYLGAALLLFDSRPTARVAPSEWLIVLGALTGFVSLMGIFFGADPLYRLPRAPVIGVALPTSIGILLISVGLLFERTERGLMCAATAPTPGGTVIRRLMPAAILGPAFLGLMVSSIFAAVGIQDLPLVIATLTTVATTLSLALLFVTARPLDRVHAALEAIRARTRSFLEQASEGIFVADLDGRYVDVNSTGCRMLGYSRGEIVGKTVAELIRPEDIERLEQEKQMLLEGRTQVSEWDLRRKDGTYLSTEVSAKILPDGRWQGFVRDIGERKRAQEQLRQSQDRFELALKGADLAAWDWNIKTGEVIFNPRWAELRGFRLEEIEPHVDSWMSGIHPDDRLRVEKAVDEYFAGRCLEYETEHRVRTRSGEWRWVLDRGKVFARDDDGQPIRMVGTELDITERKRLEEELRLSEAKSSGILSISADAIISVDEDRRISMFNDGAERIFGYTKAEALGAPLDVLIPVPLRAIHRQHVEQFAAERGPARRMGNRVGTILGLRKNGERFPADAAISRIDVGGKGILTVSLRDVTEQKRLEREQRLLAEAGAVVVSSLDLEKTLSRIAELVARDLGDFCFVDLYEEGGKLRRLRAASRDPSKAWACELLMRTPLDRERPHLARAALETKRSTLTQHLSEESVASFAQSEEHLRALRGVDPKAVIAVPLVAHENLLGALIIVSSSPSLVYGSGDVRLAEELASRVALSIDNARLYRIAQRAIETRDEVLGVVAHDLRNPLATILMQAKFLRRSGGESGPQSPRPIEAIERAATRMNRLIRDLLDVTRVEAGPLSLESARVTAQQIVADARETQLSSAFSASLDLRVDFAEDLPDVWADRDRLLQVFENLIGNAVKFTKPGDQIIVGAAPRESDVLFWVADTGRGIAAEDLPHVFDRFWQARKAGRGGAGLGLAIVKGIVDAHRGDIWAESTPGSGSVFYFTIPTADRVEHRHSTPVH